jgi:hypothetical protein
MKLRLSLLSKRRQAVLAVRTIVRYTVKKHVILKLELRSGSNGERAFERVSANNHRVDGLAGRLLL